ncbi:MAG: 30S ribosomal protein S17 [Atribacterota bacterium]
MANQKRQTGKVISNKMNKTVVIKVTRITEHPVYSKKMKITKSFKAHDEKEICEIGDIVLIEETRPLSKTVRWRVLEVIEKAKVKGGEELDSTTVNA